MATPLFTFLFSALSLMHVVYVACQCLESERDHLLQLKASVKLATNYSTKLITWNQSLDCCLWRGVGCSKDGRVISLDLSGEGIKEGFDSSSSLFNLKYLERLNLAFNDVNSTFPAKFDELGNLKYLNLSNSGFSGQIPIAISRLMDLQTLDISSYLKHGNIIIVPLSLRLENPNLDTLIRNLSNLQELRLDGVKITTKDDNWVRAISSSLPNLRVLSLSRCGLNGTVDSSLLKLRHLTELRLSDNHLQGIFPHEIFRLQGMRTIDLSGNENLQGSFPEISMNNSVEELVLSLTKFSGGLPYSIGNLKSLWRLEIQGCRFSGEIPKSLSNLTKLALLSFSYNRLTGSIDSTHWEGLTKLEYLDLSSNSLSGSIPMSVFRAPSLKVLYLIGNQFNDIHSNEQLNLSSTSQLSRIYLSSNNLSGPFPHFFFNLKQLSRLGLSRNNFSGPLPHFSSMENLSILSLSQNNFSGPLPDFSSMENLYYLHLSSNSLSGQLPNALFKCENLSFLDLSYNSFSSIFDLNMIINRFKNLQSIDLSYSGLSVVDDGIDIPSPLPPLSSMLLVSCGLKRFPAFLRNKSHLFELDLSNNQISGAIPTWIWEVTSHFGYLNLSHNCLEDMGIASPVVNVPSIDSLDLHANRLRGELPFFPSDASYLDYSMNNFSSAIPSSIIGSSGLYFLSLANNNLRGSIPESICNSSEIGVLDLSNNSLSGPIPQCISTALTDSLQVLNLGTNHLSGTVSDELFQPGCQLEILDLNGNRLSGKIPNSLLNCKGLQVLNLGNNQIRDTFPCWLQEISNVSVLVLRSNEFHGGLGCPSKTKEAWSKLQIADLSSNNFTGKLFPKWFLSLKAMMVVNESKPISNVLDNSGGLYYQDVVTLNVKGNEMKLEKILTILTSIDLSGNNLEGGIPRELGDLRALYCLNLSRNNFVGQIPPSLGSLKQLESLDLSRNKLSGSIPQQLSDLSFLQVLNLSFNQLAGHVPRGGQFDNLCEDSFLGNKGLVGPQVTRKCNGDGETSVATPPSDNTRGPKKKSEEITWVLIGAEVGFTCGLGVVVGSLVFWRRWREWYFGRVEQFLSRIVFRQKQRRPNQLRTSVRN